MEREIPCTTKTMHVHTAGGGNGYKRHVHTEGVERDTYTLTQCCGSRMFIPDHDFYPSRIPDPKTATKKLSLSTQKYEFGIRDPGSRKTSSGSRIQGSKRHRSPDPQHCLHVNTDSLVKGIHSARPYCCWWWKGSTLHIHAGSNGKWYVLHVHRRLMMVLFFLCTSLKNHK